MTIVMVRREGIMTLGKWSGSLLRARRAAMIHLSNDFLSGCVRSKKWITGLRSQFS